MHIFKIYYFNKSYSNIFNHHLSEINRNLSEINRYFSDIFDIIFANYKNTNFS